MHFGDFYRHGVSQVSVECCARFFTRCPEGACEVRIRLACKFTSFLSHASRFPCFFVTSSFLSPPCRPRVPLIVQPHRVVCPVVDEGRSALHFGRRQAPCASLDVPARRGCLHLIDADVYVGTASWGGEVLFLFSLLVFFSLYSILLGVVRSHWVQLHKRGVWRCVNPFRAMPLHYRNKGCYPPRKPRFHPSVSCLSTTERRVGEGRFFFRFAPIVFFSPYSILLGVVHSHCVQLYKRGIGTLCAEFRGRIGPTAKPRTMPARATSGMSVRRQKTRGQLHGNGKLFAPPSAFAFERRARRVSSNRAVVVRGRRRKDTAAKRDKMQGKNVIL